MVTVDDKIKYTDLGLFGYDEDGYIEGFHAETQDLRHQEAKLLGEQQEKLYKHQQNMAAELQKLLSEARTYRSEEYINRERVP